MIKKVLFKIEGMSCGNCVKKVEQGLSEYSPQVSLENQSVSVSYDSDEITLKDLKGQVEDLGYEVLEVTQE